MANRSNMSQDNLERLLNWFGQDRDVSAKKYLETHERLTRWFYFKGCDCPEDLADEVMDRVAKKLPPPKQDRIAVLLGFAGYVFMEYIHDRNRFIEEHDWGEDSSDTDETVVKEMRARCLDGCLEKLPKKDDRQFLLEYHKYEPGGKIHWRKAMAQARHTTLNALRLRSCRLKSVVGECVRNCFQSGGMTGVD